MTSDTPTPTAPVRCGDCGRTNLDGCARERCPLAEFWEDGSLITAEQRRVGAEWADQINAALAERERAIYERWNWRT